MMLPDLVAVVSRFPGPETPLSAGKTAPFDFAWLLQWLVEAAVASCLWLRVLAFCWPWSFSSVLTLHDRYVGCSIGCNSRVTK